MTSDVLESIAAGAARGFSQGLADLESSEREKHIRQERDLLAVVLAAQNTEFHGFCRPPESDEPVVWAELPRGDGPDRFARENRVQVAWGLADSAAKQLACRLPGRRPPFGFEFESGVPDDRARRLFDVVADG